MEEHLRLPVPWWGYHFIHGSIDHMTYVMKAGFLIVELLRECSRADSDKLDRLCASTGSPSTTRISIYFYVQQVQHSVTYLSQLPSCERLQFPTTPNIRTVRRRRSDLRSPRLDIGRGTCMTSCFLAGSAPCGISFTMIQSNNDSKSAGTQDEYRMSGHSSGSDVFRAMHLGKSSRTNPRPSGPIRGCLSVHECSKG